MKKQIYIVFLLLTLPLIGYSQNWDLSMLTDPKPYNGMKGEIDSICIYTINYADSLLKETEKIIFNEKGQMLSQVTKIREGSAMAGFLIDRGLTYTYNEDGVIDKRQHLHNGEIMLEELLKSAKPKERIYQVVSLMEELPDNLKDIEIVYSQPEKNKVEIRSGGSFIDMALIYNDKGDNVEMYTYAKDEKGKIIFNDQTYKEYDNRGFIVKRTYIGKGIEDEIIILFRYTDIDEQGNWVECFEYSENEKLPLKRIIRKIYYRK